MGPAVTRGTARYRTVSERYLTRKWLEIGEIFSTDRLLGQTFEYIQSLRRVAPLSRQIDSLSKIRKLQETGERMLWLMKSVPRQNTYQKHILVYGRQNLSLLVIGEAP
jgi:hypothetical protein